MCKGVHCVDLGESFQTHIYLQNLASIQPRTSPVKFARPSNAAAACPTGAGSDGAGQPRLWSTIQRQVTSARGKCRGRSTPDEGGVRKFCKSWQMCAAISPKTLIFTETLLSNVEIGAVRSWNSKWTITRKYHTEMFYIKSIHRSRQSLEAQTRVHH